MIDQTLHIGGVELASYDWKISFGGAKNARARGNQIRHRLLILQQARLGKRAPTPASELEMRESFLGERLASVDLGVFAFRAAHADANEDIVFQNVKRSTHAIRCPIGVVADALELFRWPPLFLILFAQTLPLFLIALFFFHFVFVAAECVFPK